MIRNILNELTARGVRHLIVSALFFVIYALCGTTIMLTILFLINRHISGESVSLVSAVWILGGPLVLKTLSNAVADMSKHFVGFDLMEHIREKIILKLKMFSLGFYTNERLGEISTVIHGAPSTKSTPNGADPSRIDAARPHRRSTTGHTCTPVKPLTQPPTPPAR